MEQNEIEKLAWELVKPAENRMQPCKSDGFNESEVHQAVIAGLQKGKELWYEDAMMWKRHQEIVNNRKEI